VVLIGTSRDVGQRLAGLEKLSDRSLRLRSHVLLGEAGDHAVAEATPGEGGRCDLG
jgi:hypothetical protein